VTPARSVDRQATGGSVRGLRRSRMRLSQTAASPATITRMAHPSVPFDGLPCDGRLGCRIRQQGTASLGLDSGDRSGAIRGGSGSFKARVERAEKPGRLQGKRVTKRLSEITWHRGEASMVRRGSTVRVRQRACIKTLQMGLLCCLIWRALGARVRDGYTFLGRAGIRGQARRLVSPCDTPHRSDEAARSRQSPCTPPSLVASIGEKLTPSPERGGWSPRSAKRVESAASKLRGLRSRVVHFSFPDPGAVLGARHHVSATADRSLSSVAVGSG
jgi:hypothetical protein